MIQKVNNEIERLSHKSADEFNKITAELDKHIGILATKVEETAKKKMNNLVEFRDIVKQQIEEDMQTGVGDTIKKELISQADEVQQTINESKEFAKSFREQKAEQEGVDS